MKSLERAISGRDARMRAPERRGFGSVIVERTVGFDLQGKTEIRFARSGFEADFFIPLEHIAFVSEHDPAPQAREESVSKPVLLADQPLEGVAVLLVEDNMLIALEAEEMLTDLGARRVVPASTLRAAEEAVLAHEFGFAMLDISVGGVGRTAPNEARLPFQREQCGLRRKHIPRP